MDSFTWHAQFALNFLMSQQSFAIYVSIPILFSDVDECSLNGTCPEHSTCANNFGSFVCTCNEGFMRNGSVCIGKDCLWATTYTVHDNILLMYFELLWKHVQLCPIPNYVLQSLLDILCKEVIVLCLVRVPTQCQ